VSFCLRQLRMRMLRRMWPQPSLSRICRGNEGAYGIVCGPHMAARLLQTLARSPAVAPSCVAGPVFGPGQGLHVFVPVVPACSSRLHGFSVRVRSEGLPETMVSDVAGKRRIRLGRFGGLMCLWLGLVFAYVRTCVCLCMVRGDVRARRVA